MRSALTITVGPSGDITGFTNAAIQAAVDHVAQQGGGLVLLAEGVYAMADSLHLRSGVTVRGSGPATVLRKSASVSSPILGYMGYGHYDISLVEPDKFAVGMGVYITDNRAVGFYTTVATLTWREGERFGLSRFLNHDYGSGGMVTSVFPVISGYDVDGATVENLAIDGNKAENAHINGCRGGGVFLLHSNRVTLRGLAVRDFNGDGISFQQCMDTLVEECVVEGHTGIGMHPGSGSTRGVMRRLTIRDNGSDGIFYCLRANHFLCEACEITGNGGHGISIGGRDTDNLIRAAIVRGNGGHGIYFRAGDAYMGANRNVIVECEIGPNRGNGQPGEVYLENTTTDIHLLDNRITPSSAVRPVAVVIADQCRRVVIAGNDVTGSDAELCLALCHPDQVAFTYPQQPLAVGPDAAPAGADRHLNAETLHYSLT